jgi:hypothetical protein
MTKPVERDDATPTRTEGPAREDAADTTPTLDVLDEDLAGIDPPEMDPATAAYIDTTIRETVKQYADKRWRRLEHMYGRLARFNSGETENAPEADAAQAGADDLTATEGMLRRLAGLLAETQAADAPTQAKLVSPQGGGLGQGLQAEYERARKGLRPGDLNGLLALKRQYREKGLAVF